MNIQHSTILGEDIDDEEVLRYRLSNAVAEAQRAITIYLQSLNLHDLEVQSFQALFDSSAYFVYNNKVIKFIMKEVFPMIYSGKKIHLKPCDGLRLLALHGSGTVGGVVIGALLLGVINMGMSIMGIGDSWQYVVKGAVLLIAVVFDVISNRKSN